MDYLKVQKQAMTDLYKLSIGKKADRWIYEEIGVATTWVINGVVGVKIPNNFLFLNKNNSSFGETHGCIEAILDAYNDDYKEMFVFCSRTAPINGKHTDLTVLYNYVPENERFEVNVNSKLLELFGKPWELTFYAKDKVHPVFVYNGDELAGIILPVKVHE